MEQLNSNLVFALAAGGIVAAFIFFLACAGHKAATTILLFVVIASFDVTFRNRGFGDKGLDAQVLVKLSIWSAAGLFALSRATRLRAAFREPAVLIWLLLLAWFAMTSAYASNPLFSSIAVAMMFGVFLFFIAAVGEFELGEIGSIALMAAGTISAISLIGYFVSPDTMRLWSWIDGDLVRTTRIVGITGHANSIGGIGAFGVLVARIFWRDMKRSRFWLHLTAAVLCLIVLLLSQSRTSIGGLVVIVGCYELMRLRQEMRPVVVLGVLAAIVLGLVTLITYDPETTLTLLTRSGELQEVLTVTGRTAIWGATLELWSKAPILGWGYGSSAYVIPQISSSIGFVVAQTHSMIIQVMLSGGLVALSIFVAAIITTARALVRGRNAAAAALLGSVFIGGLTEGSAFNNTPDLSFAALSLGIALMLKASLDARSAHEPSAGVSPLPAPARSHRYTRG